MIGPPLVLLLGMAIGFGIGYCIRELISQRRRKRYRNSVL